MTQPPEDVTPPDDAPPAPPGYSPPPAPPGYSPPPAPPGYSPPPAPPGYSQAPVGYGQAQPGYGQAPPGYNAALDPQAKSKIVAGLLGIFLGGLGIHRFYLGFNKIGVIQIVVTVITCGLGSLWGFVEGILYLVGAGGYTTDADGRPLKD